MGSSFRFHVSFFYKGYRHTTYVMLIPLRSLPIKRHQPCDTLWILYHLLRMVHSTPFLGAFGHSQGIRFSLNWCQFFNLYLAFSEIFFGWDTKQFLEMNLISFLKKWMDCACSCWWSVLILTFWRCFKIKPDSLVFNDHPLLGLQKPRHMKVMPPWRR